MDLRINKDIAILEFDDPFSKVNLLSIKSIEKLDAILDALSLRNGLNALIIKSKKENNFIAGADIKELRSISSMEQAFNMAEKGKRVFEKLENLKCITVALINGSCVGGGLELALSCKYRAALLNSHTRIGLPEIKLGIVPGWGGTHRLLKLIGYDKTIKLLVTGELISAREAFRSGIIDKLIEKEDIKKLSQKRFYRKKKTKVSCSKNTLAFNEANKLASELSKRFGKAPLAILDLIGKGFLAETKTFSRLVVTKEAKNLMDAFFLVREFKDYKWILKERAFDFKRCIVIGSGAMGKGIAYSALSKDIPVVIKGIDNKIIKKSISAIKSLFNYSIDKGYLTKSDLAQKSMLIKGSIDYNDYRANDIIIEAVPENMEIKKHVFKELSLNAAPGAIIASNTSSFSITRLSQYVSLPERFIGIHFFNPVESMKLVEIVKSEKTSDVTLAMAIDFVRFLGKIPIVVKDVPGFLVNRVLFRYFKECFKALEEGEGADAIDLAAKDFGMPLGPFELIDKIGIDVTYNVAHSLESVYGSRMKVSPLLEKLKKDGILGKKKGISKNFVDRMICPMIDEADMCLKEGVVKDAKAIDLAMALGIGYPVFRGRFLQCLKNTKKSKLLPGE